MMLFALLLAGSQPPEDPAAFVRRTYAAYADPNYSPLAQPEKLFSPTLAKAIRKDGGNGEVGYLDGDPLCDCQDFEQLSARIESVRRPGSRFATVSVHVTLGPKDSRNIRLSMVLNRVGWQISDIVDPRGHSLLKELQRANAGRKPD